jgi:hypothetical protein
MLIPRFSLLQLLAITTGSACFFFIVAAATRGQYWAIAISVALASVLCVAAVYMQLFLAAWVLARIASIFPAQRAAKSPFASAAPPPQFITPPQDVEG